MNVSRILRHAQHKPLSLPGVKGYDYPMVTVSELEHRRSPGELREFVDFVNKSVRADESERHRGILKRGLYKEFLDEIVPLSHFCELAYPESYKIQWVHGNQGYDALVFNEAGQEVDRVEITTPHDGSAKAQDAQRIVTRGHGKFDIGTPGDLFVPLLPHVLSVCRKKALKDYSDCTLVIAIKPLSPYQSFDSDYEKTLKTLVGEMAQIPLRAKRIFLLCSSDGLPDRLEHIHS